MKKDFKPIQDTLENFLQKYHLKENYDIQYLNQHWSDILTKQLSKISEPVSLENKVLTVKVKSKLWRKELLQWEKNIIEKIRKYSNGKIQIEKVKII